MEAAWIRVVPYLVEATGIALFVPGSRYLRKRAQVLR
jgi:hypothetical protein